MIKMSEQELKIRDDLAADKIGWSDALNALKALPKAWDRKEWKEARRKLIKDCCERCDSLEPPFVLNHTWHPPKFYSLLDRILEENGEEISDQRLKLAGKYELLLREIKSTKVPCCPRCKSTSFTSRKRTNDFVCNYGRYGYSKAKLCGNKFTKPAELEGFTPSQKREISQLKADWYMEALAARDACSEKRSKEAVLAGFEYKERYLSLKDTETLCKKCAFLWDEKGMIICSSCKNNYIPRHLQSCNDC